MKRVKVGMILLVTTMMLLFCLYCNLYTVTVRSVGFMNLTPYAISCKEFDDFENWDGVRESKIPPNKITNIIDIAKVLYYFKKYSNEPLLIGQGTDARVKVVVLKGNTIVDTLCLDAINVNPIDINGRIVAGIPEMHRFFLRYVPKEYKLD